jgi:uncharacterized protein YggE
MKRIGIGVAGAVFGLIAALTLPSLGQSTASSGSSAHTVTVAGTATIKSAPDEAVVSLGVQTNGATAEGALQQNAQRMNHVLDALIGFGIGKSDIATNDVSLYPNYKNDGSGVLGYQASNSVEVTVKNIGKVGKVIDTAVGAGANLTGGISFRVSDQNQGLNDALAAAVKDSRGKADVLAVAGGAQLGSVVSIDETTAAPQPPVRYDLAAGAGGASTPINPPTLQTQIYVTVVWALV